MQFSLPMHKSTALMMNAVFAADAQIDSDAVFAADSGLGSDAVFAADAEIGSDAVFAADSGLGSDTTKRLMSSPKCRSVEVINNPARPGSNHREVYCINYS